MSPLRIHLFGRPRVYLGERQLTKFPTLKAEQLFCYLLLNRQRSHSRDVLASLFWGDSSDSHARKCMRTTLWRLRSFFEPHGTQDSYLLIENNEIGFNLHSEYWLDVEEFEKASSSLRHLGTTELDNGFLDKETQNSLSSAVELYQGDLLEGYYEDWCLYERERLQSIFLGDLASLLAYHRRQANYGEAVRCGNRILSHDPLLEEVHRQMMRLHCLAGNRGAALRQYRLCRGALAKELNIEPMEETNTLYAQICQLGKVPGNEVQALDSLRTVSDIELEAPSARVRKFQPPLASHVDRALDELRLVRASLQDLSARFERGVQTLETVKQEMVRNGA